MRLANRLAAKAGIDERAQHGAAVVIVAVSMVVLLGFAAFSVDFGWLYLNGIRIQHGADAAALAGVVYEPGDQTTAYLEARNSASENGYNDGAAGTTVTPIDYSDDPSAVDNQYQLRVTVEDSVDTFFMKIFGIDTISMSRTAVAEYVLPLPMGSDLPYFGEDPSDPSRDPHFWGNIHGYYTGRTMGDRYSSQCVDGGAGSSCAKNPERRQTTYDGGIPVSGGYVYGIEVGPGASDLAVEVFDGPFYRGGGDSVLVGDNEQGGSAGPTTWFILYAPDPTPLNTTDNEVLCSWSYGPEDSFADFNGDGSVNNGDDQDSDGDLDWDDVEAGLPGGVASLWDRICGTTFDRGAGVYPLRVVVDDPGSSDDRGLNRYALRAYTSGTQPRLYGLGDMAVYVNFSSNEATLNLAEVQDVHAGKDLVIELWDPDSGNNGTQIFLPDGTSPPCSWSNLDGSEGGTLTSCDISYASSLFNNKHLQIRVHVPDTYVCSANCWWKIKVTYTGFANDTTTWSAHIEGNPVALVE
jgi:hypothetical protein